MRSIRLVSGITLLAALSSLWSCASLETSLDNRGLAEGASNMVAAPRRFGEPKGDPAELKANLADFDPFSRLDDAAIGNAKSLELDRWRLEGMPGLHQEKIVFPSSSPLRGDREDDAVFYLYYRGELRGKPLILWVPGYGVSDLAFRFIRRLFKAELGAV